MKKEYIKPSLMALTVTSTQILAGSDFGNGGSGNPSGGRAKEGLFDMTEDNSNEE